MNDVRDLCFVSSVVILPSAHQVEDVALILPKIIINKALLVVLSLKIVSKFNNKF